MSDLMGTTMNWYVLGGSTALSALLFAIVWQKGLLMTVWTLVVYSSVAVAGIVTGILLVLCSGEQRNIKAAKKTEKAQLFSQTLVRRMAALQHPPYKHEVAISKNMDKTLQEVFDYFIRDFCLSWFSELGKDETAFVEIITKEIWVITVNLVERLKKVDLVKVITQDFINQLNVHFQSLRESDPRNTPEGQKTPPFRLHYSLESKERELEFLRKISEVLLYCLLSPKNSHCTTLRYLLRELMANCLFLPLADMMCDPDYINQTLLLQLEARQIVADAHKQSYAYAETYEEFIKMINTSQDVDTLKQIRYHIIAEIMQATTVNNLRGIDRHGSQEVLSQKQDKGEMLRARNLKKYINQCTVAKALCEKRIKLLGGPDYNYSSNPKGYEEKKKKGTRKAEIPKTKVLYFSQVMDNSLARSYFMQFLQKFPGGPHMLGFWMAVENLRLVEPDNLPESAKDVYQTFVVPSAEKSVRIDTVLVRKMEGFLHGTCGPECFFEAQNEISERLQKNFYRKFVLSEEYFMFVCQSESAMDDLRYTHGESEEDSRYAWDEGIDTVDAKTMDQQNLPTARKPSTVEDRNEYINNKLQILDQKIADKKEQLEMTRRSPDVDLKELEDIEREIEDLITERRHLEFHHERTVEWCENIGKWKVQIQTVQYDPTNDKSVPVYVIVVHCLQDNSTQEQAHGINLAGPSSAGWVVTRQFKDFQTLHNKMKECSSKLSKELPTPTKKWYKTMDADFLEKSRWSLEEYLQSLLADEKLVMSEELYSFLSPSPEHLRKTSTQDKKTGLLILNVLKNLPFDAASHQDVEEEEEDGFKDRRDSIAEPLYLLIGEVFELKGVFKWLRRSLIAFVQVTFGGTINRQVRELMEWFVSESMVIYYIQNLRDAIWPGGVLAKPVEPRTEMEKEDTKKKAREKLIKSIPEVLQNLVGKRNSKLGVIKMFDGFQDLRTNKHLFYILLEIVVMNICPEIGMKSSDVSSEQITSS